MPYTASLSGFILSVLSAFLTVGSPHPTGRLVLERIGAERLRRDVSLSLVFGLNHLLFLFVSLFLNGPDAVLSMNTLHGAILGYFVVSRTRDFVELIRTEGFMVLLMIVLLLPYLYQLFSSPMNVDGAKIHLPCVEWVYLIGLAFNPHLTS